MCTMPLLMRFSFELLIWWPTEDIAMRGYEHLDATGMRAFPAKDSSVGYETCIESLPCAS